MKLLIEKTFLLLIVKLLYILHTILVHILEYNLLNSHIAQSKPRITLVWWRMPSVDIAEGDNIADTIISSLFPSPCYYLIEDR